MTGSHLFVLFFIWVFFGPTLFMALARTIEHIKPLEILDQEGAERRVLVCQTVAAVLCLLLSLVVVVYPHIGEYK